MSIQELILSLTEINKEIGITSKKLSKLRKQANEINSKIAEYITTKEQIGVKYAGNAFILDKKTKKVAKPKKIKEESYLQIIEQYGIENPKTFLDELLSAGKIEKEVSKLKIEQLK